MTDPLAPFRALLDEWETDEPGNGMLALMGLRRALTVAGAAVDSLPEIETHPVLCCDYRDHGGNLADCLCACHQHDEPCWTCGGRGCPDCLEPDANPCVGCGSNANPCGCDPNRDNEAFEGWGPGR